MQTIFFIFLKVNEDRHYMKRKEANAFEEQLLKEKMDELHKKLHQVAEPPQESLSAFQESPEVCVQCEGCLSPFCALFLELILVLNVSLHVCLCVYIFMFLLDCFIFFNLFGFPFLHNVFSLDSSK